MSSPIQQRYFLIDCLRGSAIALMFIYHFCYDLKYFGYLQIEFNEEPFWVSFRYLIVSLFLGLVGVSLQLAHSKQWRPHPWFRRQGLLLGAALLVTIMSYIMFPWSIIWFGILHFIAVASLLGLLFLRFYWLNLLLGIVFIMLYNYYSHPVFDHPALHWIGMVTKAPKTEDYVPLVPWFGVVLIGMFIGRSLFLRGTPASWLGWHSAHPLFRTLSLAGKHSLPLYLIHQPIFFALLYLVELFASH